MAEFVVVGGTGQIGAKTVSRLRESGRDAVAASPGTGVDLLTGAGLDAVLQGARVVIDVSKPRATAPDAVHEYFTSGMANLLRAEREHGIRHHLALSIVGSDRHDVPFYAGKVAGERAVRESAVPYTIVHATQFFEFAPAIAAQAEADGVVTLPDALVQPCAGADVADLLVELALGEALSADLDVAGPDRMPLAEFVSRALLATGDHRVVHAGPKGMYFGGGLEREALVPGPDARILPTSFGAWLLAHS
ncbi:SDR family oxidoreductase [Microbacterium sp.]|uniref:SDR family oxidoreductase n=1 Tax=Microbacterium sp. TaxID=51671 RepID=UPI003A8FB504